MPALKTWSAVAHGGNSDSGKNVSTNCFAVIEYPAIVLWYHIFIAAVKLHEAMFVVHDCDGLDRDQLARLCISE